MISAKQEAELLADAMLALAKQILQQHGAFPPFGSLLQADGSVVQVGADDSRNATNSASLDTLSQLLREQVAWHKAKAAAIACNTRVIAPGTGHPSPAIEVLVQHRDSYCADMLFPYQLKEGQLRIAQVFARTCGRRILD